MAHLSHTSIKVTVYFHRFDSYFDTWPWYRIHSDDRKTQLVQMIDFDYYFDIRQDDRVSNLSHTAIKVTVYFHRFDNYFDTWPWYRIHSDDRKAQLFQMIGFDY